MVRVIREEITRGDTNVIPFLATDKSSRVIDLTFGTVRFTVKDDLGKADVDALIILTSPDDILLHSDGTTGLGEVVIPPSATSSLLGVTHNFSYDIQHTSSTNVVQTFQRGPLIVLPDASITSP